MKLKIHKRKGWSTMARGVRKVDADKMVAVEKNTGANLDYMGNLMWFTITECRVNRTQLEESFKKAGIDEKYLPNPINERDAFRRATKMGESNRVPVENQKGLFINIMMREVSTETKMVVRQMVREVVDGSNKKLEYKPIVELRLDNGSLSWGTMEDTDGTLITLREEELKAVEKIVREYDLAKENYNGQHVRNMIQGILNTCSPISVRSSGGVYFTPSTYDDTIRSLQKLVNEEIDQYSIQQWHSRLWMVPVVNADDQRQMVEESLEEQVMTNSKALIEEMSKFIKSGRKVTQSTATNYVEKVKAMQRMVREYEGMLETNAVNAQSNLEILMAQAVKLLEHVDIEGAA
jgi:hypothetical protein